MSEEIQESTPPESFTLIRQFARWARALSTSDVALGTGALYVIGFVAANAQLGAFGVLSFDLWAGRYLAAGFLMLLFTTPFMYGGVLLSEVFFRGLDWGNPGFLMRERLTSLFAGLIVIVASWLVLIELVLNFVAMRGASEARLYTGVYAGMSVLVGAFFMHGHWKFEGRGGEGISAFGSLFFGSLMILGLAMYFSFIIHSEIDPAFGGGAGWVVEGVPVADVEGIPRGEMLILRMADGVLTAVVCESRTGEPPVYRQINMASYYVLEMNSKSSVRRYIGERTGRMCGTRTPSAD